MKRFIEIVLVVSTVAIVSLFIVTIEQQKQLDAAPAMLEEMRSLHQMVILESRVTRNSPAGAEVRVLDELMDGLHISVCQLSRDIKADYKKLLKLQNTQRLLLDHLNLKERTVPAQPERRELVPQIPQVIPTINPEWFNQQLMTNYYSSNVIMNCDSGGGAIITTVEPLVTWATNEWLSKEYLDRLEAGIEHLYPLLDTGWPKPCVTNWVTNIVYIDRDADNTPYLDETGYVTYNLEK